MRKKRICLSIILVAAATFLGGEPCDIACMENKQLCSSAVVGTCSQRWSFNVGLIAEQISMTGTEVADLITSQVTGYEGGGSGLVITDTIQSIQFDMDLGLRIGLGYLLDHDDWMAKASFEWLSSKGSLFQDTTGGGTIFPYAIPSPFYDGNTIALSDVAAGLRVNYYLLDVELSKGVFFSKHFSYEPFAGIKASWINYIGDQSFRTVDMEDMAVGTVFKRNTKVHFWGVGPMIGLHSNYFVVEGWSLFSSANVSVLFGEASTFNFVRLVPTGDSGYLPELSYENSVAICPTIRAIVGLQYDCLGYSEAQNMVFRIGFDGRYYFNQYPYLGYTENPISVSGSALPNYISSTKSYIPTTLHNALGMIGLVADLVWHF
ncbi:MAG: hypothetical protein SP1CHLAM9_10930 [Chlamydiia bacterium]|nr:hypothetical protein [Chlamydiia bacterium]